MDEQILMNKNSSTLTREQIARERHRVLSNCRRTSKFGNPSTLTLTQWLEILDRYNWQCAYCLEAPYQILEHCRSVRYGGGTTAENCVPACVKCNSKKHLRQASFNSVTNTLEISNPQVDDDYFWFTEKEVLANLGKVCVCEDVNAKVIVFMVRDEVLLERVTSQGTLYRFPE